MIRRFQSKNKMTNDVIQFTYKDFDIDKQNNIFVIGKDSIQDFYIQKNGGTELIDTYIFYEEREKVNQQDEDIFDEIIINK